MEEISRNIQTRRDFWISKIQKNKERDKEVNEQLTHEGWLVLRYWESQIKKDANGVAEEIISYLPVKHVQKKQ